MPEGRGVTTGWPGVVGLGDGETDTEGEGEGEAPPGRVVSPIVPLQADSRSTAQQGQRQGTRGMCPMEATAARHRQDVGLFRCIDPESRPNLSDLACRTTPTLTSWRRGLMRI